MFEKNLNISILLDFYGDILSDRQKEMLDMYYNDDMSLAEIAQSFDISRQGVRSVLKKAKQYLQKWNKSLILHHGLLQYRKNQVKLLPVFLK